MYIMFMITMAVLRKKLSRKLDACVLDRPCREPSCEHRNKGGVWWVVLVNVGFTLLNVFHLAYLGLMFGGSEDEDAGLEQQVSIIYTGTYIVHVHVHIRYTT